MTKANNGWKEKWNYLLNKKKDWKNPDEVNKILTEFVEKTLQEQREEIIEKMEKLIDKDMAKKLGDNLKIYWGKRYCPICGFYPEKQRKIILKIMEEK